MYESTDKMVSHPSHYQTKSGLEVIDVIEAFTEDLQGVKATDTGNIIKYACRWNKKGTPIMDVEKIIWYGTHLLERLKKEEAMKDKYGGLLEAKDDDDLCESDLANLKPIKTEKLAARIVNLETNEGFSIYVKEDDE